MDYQEQIDKLEAERENLNERCRLNSNLREKLKGEYDIMTSRRLEAQKEINHILKAEIDRCHDEKGS